MILSKKGLSDLSVCTRMRMRMRMMKRTEMRKDGDVLDKMRDKYEY